MCFHSYVKISFLGRDPFWKRTKEPPFGKQPRTTDVKDHSLLGEQLTLSHSKGFFGSSTYYQAFTANCIREIPFISTTRWVQVDMGFEPMAAG